MTEKINYKDFRENFSFDRKGKGLKAIPKPKSAQSNQPNKSKEKPSFTTADVNFKEDADGNISFYLPIELVNDNDGRTHHFSRASSRRKRYESVLRMLGLIRKNTPDYPQKLTIVRILGKGQKLMDEDSLMRGNVKELIDSLKACGWFLDDKPKYLPKVEPLQDDAQRENGFQILIKLERYE